MFEEIEIIYINYCEKTRSFDFKNNEIIYKVINDKLKLTDNVIEELQKIVWTMEYGQSKILKYIDKYNDKYINLSIS